MPIEINSWAKLRAAAAVLPYMEPYAMQTPFSASLRLKRSYNASTLDTCFSHIGPCVLHILLIFRWESFFIATCTADPYLPTMLE